MRGHMVLGFKTKALGLKSNKVTSCVCTGKYKGHPLSQPHLPHLQNNLKRCVCEE